MTLIITALLLAALYSGAMYIYLVVTTLRAQPPVDYAHRLEIERQTFHLGLCFIVAIGFLGLVVK